MKFLLKHIKTEKYKNINIYLIIDNEYKISYVFEYNNKVYGSGIGGHAEGFNINELATALLRNAKLVIDELTK